MGAALTVDLDPELVARAQARTGIDEPSELVREALLALLERDAIELLTLMGGTEADPTAPPRDGSD